MKRSGVLLGVAQVFALTLCGCGGAPGGSGRPADRVEEQAGLLVPAAAGAQGGFSTLAYNVAGLLEPFSSGSPAASTPIISCRIRGYDVVNVQEDFNYHAALYDSCDDHPYRSATSGGMGVGSGLNTLSRFPYEDWERVKWKNCTGVDCLTPKGFTLARLRLAEGVFVDLYNLHTQAETTDAALAARRANIRQLVEYIEGNSAGNAVIVMGDTNTRYTREGDNPRELLLRGFTDVWVSRIRGGSVPTPGGAATACSPNTTSPDCEVVDKVLYRDNGFVGLAPLSYLVDNGSFLDAAGKDLSDHWPVKVDWSYSTRADRRLSDRIGGPHGNAFNDVSLLPPVPVVKRLALRSGDRIDRVEVTLSTGAILSHGGTGGAESSLDLAGDEALTAVDLCSGKYNGTTRVFHARFTTSSGRSLAGGRATSDCTTYRAPEGWQIVGFHGRSAEEVDKLGVVYAPRPGGAVPGPAAAFELRNRASGLCLDVWNGRMQPGTPVSQWHCSGSAWQRWTYDPATGLVRSEQDPRYCLDAGGSFGNDDSVHTVLWTCTGNANQRFLLDEGAGILSLRSAPGQVLDGFGTAPGSPAITWTDWGGANQRWSAVH